MTPSDPVPAREPYRGDDAKPKRFISQRVLVTLYSLLGVVTLVVLGYVELSRGIGTRTLGVELLCTMTALGWVGVAAWRARWSGWRPHGLRPAQWLPALAVLIVAFALHYQSLAYLPLPHRTGFEELQMGGDGYRLLTTHVLPLELRFCKLLAAGGLWLGGYTLEALRLPFQIMGYLRLAVLILCLRALRVGWWPAAFVTITAAVARWFVIGAGLAYEDFSPVLFLLLLIWCLAKVDLARTSAATWAAAAGVLAGMLMFENSSFRFAVLLAVAWLLWLAVHSGKSAQVNGFARWRPLMLLTVTLVVVAAPMLVNILHGGEGSVFFEAINRYAHERSTLIPPTTLANLKKSLTMLAGRPVQISFYLAPEWGHAIHPLIGDLFVVAAAAGLLWPRTGFVRALVLSAAFAVIACSLTTNVFAATRLAPVFWILLVTLGAFLEDLSGWLRRALSWVLALSGSRGDTPEVGRGARPQRVLAAVNAIVFVGLSIWMVDASALRVRAMARDRNVQNEYINDQYVTAAYLAKAAKPKSHVIVVTPGGDRDWSQDSIAYWVYAAKQLRVEGMPKLPGRESIAMGTMVVLGAEGRALTKAEIAHLAALAEQTDSLDTLNFQRGMGGRVLVASICIACEEDARSSGTR
jgi:hypothetical protein